MKTKSKALSIRETQELLGAENPVELRNLPKDPIGMLVLPAITASSKYECPVCNYDQLDEDPVEQNFNICPCCGTEFGYDDNVVTYEALRRLWVAGGSKWWNTSQPDPRKTNVNI